MRLIFLFIILAVFGGILAAGIVIDNRALSPGELDSVTAVCQGCHGQVPKYHLASRVHAKHAAFECGFCHRDNTSLQTANSLHGGLERIGIGILIIGFAGIITNLLVVYRGKVK